jgi:site-specific DNA-methyltransferase (adenine-specific)
MILMGDIREIARTIEPVDCIIADPPYGETSLAWDRWPDGWVKAVYPLLKPTGSMWVFGSMRMFFERAGDFAGWRLAQDIVWEKHNGTGLFNDRFRRVHENALQFYPAEVPWGDVYKAPQFTNDATARTVRKKAKPAHWIGAVGATVYKSEDGGPRLQRSVMYVRSEHGRAIHPTQKPIGILLPLVRYSCPPGGTVLDPFCGSGSTAIAAREAGCQFVGVEVNPEYVEAANDRLRNDAPLFAANR